jgi:hypothetical protein
MDHWDLVGKLRAPAGDALRRWAEMEGKSPTMRDDLYRSARASRPIQRIPIVVLATSGKLIAAFVHACVRSSQ